MLTSNKYKLEKLIIITEMIQMCESRISDSNIYLKNFCSNSVIWDRREWYKNNLVKYTNVKNRLTNYYNNILSKLKTI